MRSDWDENKATANETKHGVSFQEAATVFEDPYHVVYFDPDHSDHENRFIIVGESNANRLLIVSYVEKRRVTRLISAREATRSERKSYEEEI